MGYVGDQVRFQPFAAHLFLQRLFQAGADPVDHLAHLQFLSRQALQIHLVGGVAAGDILNGVSDPVIFLGNGKELVEYQVIAGQQAEEQKHADHPGRRITPKLIHQADEAHHQDLRPHKGPVSAEQPVGEGPVSEIQRDVLLQVVEQAVLPKGPALIAAQQAERADHAAGVDDHCPEHALRKLPGMLVHHQMDQPVADLFPQEQHEQGGNAGQHDTAFGGDGIPVMQVRPGPVQSLIAGHHSQIAQGGRAAQDAQHQSRKAFGEPVLDLLESRRLFRVHIPGQVTGVHGDTQEIAVRVLQVAALQSGGYISRTGIQIGVY